MDVWIETTAGTLVKASAMTHIVMREAKGIWEVSVSASAAPALFATGLTGKDAARAVRNRLALTMTTAAAEASPQVIAFDDEDCTVGTYQLAA